MKKSKNKFQQYQVRGKHKNFQVIMFPRQKYMWAYYEGFDGRYEIDGDAQTYRLLKYALAILAADPRKIIYFPLVSRELGNSAWGNCYDAVLCRPELQLRRSEWVDLPRQLDRNHRMENYVLRYEPQKLCDEWAKIEAAEEW